jgi:hypothetical protein
MRRRQGSTLEAAFFFLAEMVELISTCFKETFAMTTKMLDTASMCRYISGDDTPVKKNTAEGWRVKGFGPPWVKCGGLVRYRIADLDAWLESQTRHSTSERGAKIDKPCMGGKP